MVASVRKWFETFDGGVVLSNKEFSIKAKRANKRFVRLRRFEKFFKSRKTFCPFKLLSEKYGEKADLLSDKKYQLYSISRNAAIKILQTDFNITYNHRLHNSNKFQKILGSSAVVLKNNGLLTVPCFLLNIDYEHIQGKIEKLRNAGIRCASFWDEDLNLACEYNICFDLNKNYDEQKIKNIQNILKG